MKFEQHTTIPAFGNALVHPFDRLGFPPLDVHFQNVHATDFVITTVSVERDRVDGHNIVDAVRIFGGEKS